MGIEAIVFDLGKVLVDFDYSLAANKIASRAKILSPEIHKIIAQPPLLFQYETGLMRKEEFFSKVCDLTGYCGTLDEFSGLFADIFSPIDEMIALQANLRKRGFPTYIFSNTNDMAIAHIRRNFPFFSSFDAYILSYEHGSMKPDSKLYEVVEEISGKKSGQILYLDDREENVEAGRVRGWNVILQLNPRQTIERVQKLGLLNS
jgi:HAD superfamily hydrolase (TIGR01509 family)